MGGLNTALLSGLQALNATQAALEATSNNIANANTPGYTREVAQFSEQAESMAGGQVVGGGVSLDGLVSVRNELLNLQLQQQTSAQSSADTQSSSLGQIQQLFANSGEDLASMFSAFSTSLVQLSSNPGNAAVRQSVLNAGENLAKSFNSTAAGLTGAQAQVDQQVTTTVGQINSLTAQIANLNSQLAQQPASSITNGGTIQDQRDELVQQLSALTGISVSQGSDGETITTANGSPLVMGGKSYNLQTTTGSGGMQQVMDSNGNNITAKLSGGQLGGLIQVRDQALPGFLGSLNTLATEFASAFNAAQAKGYTPGGSAGPAFFSVPGNPANAASGITMALSDASQIATSSDGSAGSNGNVANLSAVMSSALPSGDTPANAYANIVFSVGTAASDASAQSSALGQSVLQLTNQQNSVSGVSLDEESVNLIRFQTAYQAAARIVSTIQALNTTTINMVS